MGPGAGVDIAGNTGVAAHTGNCSEIARRNFKASVNLPVNGNTVKQCISSLYTSRKLMIQLGGRSYIILLRSLGSPRY